MSRYIVLLAVLWLPQAWAGNVTLNLPQEREDGTPIQCELSTVEVHYDGDCVTFTVTDVNGLESTHSTQTCDACTADINNDGIVNLSDLAILRDQFFLSCF